MAALVPRNAAIATGKSRKLGREHRAGHAEAVAEQHHRSAPASVLKIQRTVDLKSSQEVRLKRLQPRSVLNAQDGVIFIPAPRDLVPGLIAFLREMWEEES